MSIEPLPPELRALIDAEPPIVPPADVASRIERRLDASTAGPSQPAAVSAPRALGRGLALFLAGALTGGGLVGWWRAPTPPVVTPQREPVISAPAPPADVRVKPTVVADDPLVRPPSAPRVARGAPAQPGSTESALEAERRLLEPARAAIARARYEPALSALNRHASEFPFGQLSEERDAMIVQALVLAGRTSEASLRAAAFMERYPDSFLRPVVEAALTVGEKD